MGVIPSEAVLQAEGGISPQGMWQGRSLGPLEKTRAFGMTPLLRVTFNLHHYQESYWRDESVETNVESYRLCSGGIGSVGYHFKFDAENKILLAQFEGQLTNESAVEYHDALGRNWRATQARAGIWDLSGVTDFAVASDFLRSLAVRKPVTPGLTDHPRYIVVPVTAAYGLMRMFQIAGESSRPLLHVVRSVEEALTALGVQSPHFEALG
jgi:hypothetical protein